MRIGQLLEAQSQALDDSMVLGYDAEEDDHDYEDQQEEDTAAEEEKEEDEEEVDNRDMSEKQREHETSRVNSLQAPGRSVGDEWLDGLVEEAIRDRMALVKARLDDAATALWDELRQVRNAMHTSLAAVHGDVEELAAAMARIGPVFCDVKRVVAAVGCLEERVKRLEEVSCASNVAATSGGTGRNNTRAGQGSLRSHEESWQRGLEAFREVQQREADALWGELSKHAAGMQAVWEEVSRVRRIQAEEKQRPRLDSIQMPQTGREWGKRPKLPWLSTTRPAVKTATQASWTALHPAHVNLLGYPCVLVTMALL